MIERLLATRSGIFIRIYRTSDCQRAFSSAVEGASYKNYEKVIMLKTYAETNTFEGECCEEKCSITLLPSGYYEYHTFCFSTGKAELQRGCHRIRRQLSSDMTRFTGRCSDFKVSRQSSYHCERKFDSTVTNKRVKNTREILFKKKKI